MISTRSTKTQLLSLINFVVIFNFLNKMQQSQARMKIKNLFKITQCEKKNTHWDQTLYKVTFKIFYCFVQQDMFEFFQS